MTFGLKTVAPESLALLSAWGRGCAAGAAGRAAEGPQEVEKTCAPWLDPDEKFKFRKGATFQFPGPAFRVVLGQREALSAFRFSTNLGMLF